MKIFCDTNVLVSAFTTRGLSADLFRLVLSEHDLLTGSVNLEESRRVMEHRFHVPPADIAFAEHLLSNQGVVALPATLPKVKIRDPDDLLVLACALEGAAELLVTGDKDLLTVRAKLPLRIVSPRNCWELLRAGRV